MRRAITAQERDRLVEALRTHPIFDVARESGRSFWTLARLAEGVA